MAAGSLQLATMSARHCASEMATHSNAEMSKSKLMSTISEEDRRKEILNLKEDFDDLNEFYSEDFKKAFKAAWQVII